MLQDAPSPEASQRGQRLHLHALRRGLVAPQLNKRPRVHGSTLAWRVADHLFPWSVETYPGIIRGVLEVLGRRITWAAVQQWQSERRPIPPWARAILADYLEARGRVALELAAELRALPVRPDKRKTGNREGDNAP